MARALDWPGRMPRKERVARTAARSARRFAAGRLRREITADRARAGAGHPDGISARASASAISCQHLCLAGLTCSRYGLPIASGGVMRRLVVLVIVLAGFQPAARALDWPGRMPRKERVARTAARSARRFAAGRLRRGITADRARAGAGHPDGISARASASAISCQHLCLAGLTCSRYGLPIASFLSSLRLASESPTPARIRWTAVGSVGFLLQQLDGDAGRSASWPAGQAARRNAATATRLRCWGWG